MYFPLARRDEPCILPQRTCSALGESESRPRRTEVKIEHVIPARPTTLPSTSKSKKKSRKAAAVATCGGDVFHGVRRHLRHRADHFRRRIRSWNLDFAISAGAVVSADSLHDWRTGERLACRRRLLRLGAPWTR